MTDLVEAVERAILALNPKWEEAEDEARAALAAIEAAGYRVLPVEVTDDMEVAANEMLHDWVCAQQCWDAMLDAAPKVTP